MKQLMRVVNFCFFISFPISLLAQSPMISEEVELKEIVVSADLNEKKVTQTPSQIQIISAAELEAKKAKTVIEALKGVSGVDLVSLGLSSDDVDIRIRGADRDNVLILLDGFKLNSVAENRAAILGAIPIDQVERIEVLKGSQSLLYGSEAVGGVIQIFTKKQKKEGSHLQLKMMGGYPLSFRESVRYSFSQNQFHVNAFYSRKDENGKQVNDQGQENNFFYSLAYQPHDKLKLSHSLYYLHASQELPYDFLTRYEISLPAFVIRVNPDLNRSLYRYALLGSAGLEAQILERWKLNSSYQFSLMRTFVSNTTEAEVAPAGYSLNTQDYRGKEYRHRFDLRNTIDWYQSDLFSTRSVLGFQFEHEDFKYSDPPSLFPSDSQSSSRQNYAPYLQQEFSFLKDRLNLNAGIRYDQNTTYGSEWSPRFGLIAQIIPDKTLLKVNYGKGFHGPTVLDFFQTALARQLGSPYLPVKLQAEKSQSIDVGLFQRFGKRAELNLSYFRIDYDSLLDELEYVPKAYSTGLEFFSRFKFKPWLEVFADYTWMLSKNKITGGSLANRPEHQGRLGIKSHLGEKLTLALDAYVSGPRLIPNTISTALSDFKMVFENSAGQVSGGSLANSLSEEARTIPAYHRIDLTAQYHFGEINSWLSKFDVFAKLENLTHQKYQEKFGFPQVGVKVLTGFEASFY